MKPKIGVFSFTGCEGCQLNILNLEAYLLDLFDVIEIVNFREAMTEKGQDYAIAFVEGSITTPEDEKELLEIREIADVLVAIGACAHLGGVNGMKQLRDLEAQRAEVYGDKKDCFPTTEVRRVSDVVPVDLIIPGCPIDRTEFVETVKKVLMGIPPMLPTNPCCVECKSKGNVCMYDKGLSCLGPVTRGGCDAICPSYGQPCDGCRGFLETADFDAMVKAMEDEHGISTEAIIRQISHYNAVPAADLIAKLKAREVIHA